MINAYHLTDATTAALLGMFALWAAGSRRHWFVRTAVLGIVLLNMLLIPAYEVLIQFSLEMLLIVGGIAVWRWRRVRERRSAAAEGKPATRFRPQMSLKTLLLLTVVVAVFTAVAARAPHFTIFQWCQFTGVGVLAAAVGLASVWVVRGQTRCWLRLLAVPPLILLLAAATRWFWIGRWWLEYWFNNPTYASQYWQHFWQEGTLAGSVHWIWTIGIGLLTTSVWVLLMDRAGWFDPFHELGNSTAPAGHTSRQVRLARWAASALFAIVLLLPIYLFYRLLMPTPIPDLASPRPNSYDDLVAAGRMIGESDGTGFQRLRQLSDAQLRDAVAKNANAFELVHLALQGDCRFPLIGMPGGKSRLAADELRALYGLCEAQYGRLILASKEGAIDEKLTANLDSLRLALIEEQSSGIDGYDEFQIFSFFENDAVHGLWQCRIVLSADECVKLANELWELEVQRAPWAARVERQRIIAENSGWEWHVRSILDGWSGGNLFEDNRYYNWLERVKMRILIAELAVRAFQLKNERLPATLAELVPDYLPAVPDDPYDPGQPLKYRETGDGYVLYSVGPDKVDNGGMPRPKQADELGGDLIDADLFPAPASPPTAIMPGAADAVDKEASEDANEEQTATPVAEPEP